MTLTYSQEVLAQAFILWPFIQSTSPHWTSLIPSNPEYSTFQLNSQKPMGWGNIMLWFIFLTWYLWTLISGPFFIGRNYFIIYTSICLFELAFLKQTCIWSIVAINFLFSFYSDYGIKVGQSGRGCFWEMRSLSGPVGLLTKTRSQFAALIPILPTWMAEWASQSGS